MAPPSRFQTGRAVTVPNALRVQAAQHNAPAALTKAGARYRANTTMSATTAPRPRFASCMATRWTAALRARFCGRYDRERAGTKVNVPPRMERTILRDHGPAPG